MLGGCDGSRAAAPAELVDGTPVRELPSSLEGLEGARVLTRVALAAPPGGTPGARSCLEEQWDHLTADALSVERRGVYGESVTLREASGRALLACDGRGATSRAVGARWCGAAYGLLVNGRLPDPRLDLLCSTDGDVVAFVWVVPLVAARYVAVEQAGFVEVYETAGSLPVRIATTRGVELERTSVVVPVSEHDRHGRLLRRYDLEAVVAG